MAPSIKSKSGGAAGHLEDDGLDAERLANIEWFSPLSPSEKIRTLEVHNRATRRLASLRPRQP